MKHQSGLHARLRNKPAMPTLAQNYEDHAEDCILAAARTVDPKRRDLLLKFAMQWREDAQGLRRSAGASQCSGTEEKTPAPGMTAPPPRRNKR
jgi:hypothetical protein